MSKRKRKTGGQRRSTNSASFDWSSEWTILWISGSFLIAYFIFVPLESHPLHWLFSLLGGFAGYMIGVLVDNWPPPIMRLVRRRSKSTASKPEREKQTKRGAK